MPLAFPASFGFHQQLHNDHQAGAFAQHPVGRIIRVDKSAVLVQTAGGVQRGTLQGRLDQLGEEGRPAVGDWVAWVPMNEGEVVILDILPRYGCLKRVASGTTARTQLLVTCVDLAFIAVALDADFNLSRVERYLAMVQAGGVAPVLLLTKTDLSQEPERFLAALAQPAPDVPQIAVSSLDGRGLEQVRALVGPGRSAVILGSSGVGKSTLINALLGHQIQEVGAIRESDQKGKHTTTARVLLPLPTGGILIDTPGLRELSPLADEAALAETFPEIQEWEALCRFRDCGHGNEPGCAVQAALVSGELSQRRLDNFLKLRKESASALARANVREARRADKRLGRMCKEAIKLKKQRNGG